MKFRKPNLLPSSGENIQPCQLGVLERVYLNPRIQWTQLTRLARFYKCLTFKLRDD